MIIETQEDPLVASIPVRTWISGEPIGCNGSMIEQTYMLWIFVGLVINLDGCLRNVSPLSNLRFWVKSGR